MKIRLHGDALTYRHSCILLAEIYVRKLQNSGYKTTGGVVQGRSVHGTKGRNDEILSFMG